MDLQHYSSITVCTDYRSACTCSTLFMGSFGSLVLVKFGWSAVFVVTGLLSLAWSGAWQTFLVKPELHNKEIKLGNIRMVEEQGTRRADRIGVPWQLFLKHPAVW